MSNGEKVIERTEVEALYRAYGSVVHRRARALLGNEAEASDAVQDVFIRVLRSYREFRGQSSPMTWLYRITTNLCLNRLRDRRRRSELHLELAEEQPSVGRRMELTPDVRKLLAALPDDAAAAGVYYYLDGMTHEEIAGVLGVSRRTAGNLVGRFDTAAEKRFGERR